MDAVRRAETIRAPAGSKPSGARTHDLTPGLYLVATPIGNLRDLTFRARDTMAAADLVACEDTRVTARLLAHYGIATKMFAYHDHNADQARPVLLERLAGGARVALVSDAGTPLISDPGYKLVRAAIARGVVVTTVPGASAALSALQLSGLPSDRFLFAGFLPSKGAARRAMLRELASVPATLIFYEAPSRLAASLRDMAEVLGERPAAVARELTKLFEQVHRAPVGELAALYDDAGAPRGEVVVVLGPPPPAPTASAEQLDTLLHAALAELSPRDAAASVARQTGVSKRLVYRRAIEIAGADRE